MHGNTRHGHAGSFGTVSKIERGCIWPEARQLLRNGNTTYGAL